MGRKWSKNPNHPNAKGGKSVKGNGKKAKRHRNEDSDSSDEEGAGKKKAKLFQPKAVIVAAGRSQLSDRMAAIPKDSFTNLAAIDKDFWTGARTDLDTMEDLKSARKTLGILVKGPGHENCPPPIVSVSDAGVPISFAAVFNKLRLTVPTLVQLQAWPAILSGNNVLCIAPTGSGKTLAFGLPLIPHISKQKLNRAVAKRDTFPVRPIGLVLVPTRELALQVAAALKTLRVIASIQVVAVYGGEDKDLQLGHLGGGEGVPSADVIVATPGRLIDLMSTKHISLSAVTYLVLDEADRMLALGFEEQLNTLAEHIRPDKQAALFSATFPGRLRNSCEKWIGEAVTLRVSTMEIKNEYLTERENQKSIAKATDDVLSASGVARQLPPAFSEAEPCEPQLSTSALAVLNDKAFEDLSSSLTLSKTVTQDVHVCVPHKKPRLLVRYILRVREKEKAEKMRQPGPMIIFCAKIKTINYLVKFLTGQGLVVDKFHGQLQQSAREKVLNEFKAVVVFVFSLL